VQSTAEPCYVDACDANDADDANWQLQMAESDRNDDEFEEGVL
jgi:hypothetical protein